LLTGAAHGIEQSQRRIGGGIGSTWIRGDLKGAVRFAQVEVIRADGMLRPEDGRRSPRPPSPLLRPGSYFLWERTGELVDIRKVQVIILPKLIDDSLDPLDTIADIV